MPSNRDNVDAVSSGQDARDGLTDQLCAMGNNSSNHRRIPLRGRSRRRLCESSQVPPVHPVSLPRTVNNTFLTSRVRDAHAWGPAVTP